MSLFTKLYLALLFAVVGTLFYGVSVRSKLQLNSVVRSESVLHADSAAGSAASQTGTGASAHAPSKPVLNDFFPMKALGAVPEDDKMGPIGSCPPSKPFSTDLPLIDVPMCMAKTQNNMRLAPTPTNPQVAH